MKINPLVEGGSILEFKTTDESGKIHSSDSLRGRTTLLYFILATIRQVALYKHATYEIHTCSSLKSQFQYTVYQVARCPRIKDFLPKITCRSLCYWMKITRLRNYLEFGERKSLWERLLMEFTEQVS